MKKILTYLGITVLCATIIGLAVLVWGFTPGSTKQIESIAADFKPDPSWTLESEKISPPRNVCLQDDCDSLYRRWSLDHTINSDEFLSSLKRSGWSNLSGQKTCKSDNGKSGLGSLQCEVKGSIDQHSVRLEAISSYEDPKKSSIVLRIYK